MEVSVLLLHWSCSPLSIKISQIEIDWFTYTYTAKRSFLTQSDHYSGVIPSKKNPPTEDWLLVIQFSLLASSAEDVVKCARPSLSSPYPQCIAGSPFFFWLRRADARRDTDGNCPIGLWYLQMRHIKTLFVGIVPPKLTQHDYNATFRPKHTDVPEIKLEFAELLEHFVPRYLHLKWENGVTRRIFEWFTASLRGTHDEPCHIVGIVQNLTSSSFSCILAHCSTEDCNSDDRVSFSACVTGTHHHHHHRRRRHPH